MAKQSKFDTLPNAMVTGCMFIGIGFGFIFHNVAAGCIIGMGVGMLLKFIIASNNKNATYNEQ